MAANERFGVSLIVDDNPGVLRDIASVVAAHGWDCLTWLQAKFHSCLVCILVSSSSNILCI
jgi:uncharacterized protein with ACT and thioredoxin-like domain